MKARNQTASNAGNNPKYPAEIRIIAGKLRGRKIPVRNRYGLRPTSDRIRETLFNWLQAEIQGAAVLDAFAGTGALGIEAISRGAIVDFVEKNTLSARDLQLILHNFAVADNNRVLQANALTIKADKKYDLIFLDPPFAEDLLAPAIAKFVSADWTREHGKIYCEMPRDFALQIPDGWQIYREKETSNLRFMLLCRIAK
ncbi:MAG: 16S rRNA (guanine(966)-N(2))-methyltransferase RsmD [Cardiobacteriaceae bacterium]|nr:16S rRNA (guanine(966)-N(2))-methyltransferase RsmD [Cardiobacteriaceae bacterium]